MSSALEFHRGGVFMIPRNFTLETLIEYMKLNITNLRHSRDTLHANIQEMNFLAGQIKINLAGIRTVETMTDVLPIRVCIASICVVIE